MSKLIWVYDSPFSRSIKWLLLQHDIAHKDYVLSWDELATDSLLALNPKRQVPTLWNNGSVNVDSLLIALEYLPNTWHQSLDANLFRLADSDVETCIIFLFRANLLENKFGLSESSEFMLNSGIDLYKQSVDYLLDHIMTFPSQLECNYGAVLLLSTIFSAISLAEDKLLDYRSEELSIFIHLIESDVNYRNMIVKYQGEPSNDVPFEYSKFNNTIMPDT